MPFVPTSLRATSIRRFSIFVSHFALKEIYWKTGKGGNAGRQVLNVRSVQGKLDLTTCRGTGGQAAANGAGGAGKGIYLRFQIKFSLLRLNNKTEKTTTTKNKQTDKQKREQNQKEK